MKTATGCAAQAVLVLALASLAAAPLACLATLTAPLHSPGYASRVLCPPGSQLESEWYQATFNEPGERTLAVSCVDAAGNPVAANPRDEITLLSGTVLYYPVCFVPLIVLGLLALAAANGLLRALRPKPNRDAPRIT
jgi:hypothetical protein